MAASPVLQQAFVSRGIVPLPPELGQASFRALLDSGVCGTVWVAAQDPPGAIEPDWPLGPPTVLSDRDRDLPTLESTR